MPVQHHMPVLNLIRPIAQIGFYKKFQNQTIDSIFTSNQLENAVILNAYNFQSSIGINNGNGTFTVKALPKEAQLSTVYAISVDDYDDDGIKDILLSGNLYSVKPEVGRYDASYGAFLKGKKDLEYEAMPAKQTGLNIEGEARSMMTLKTTSGMKLLIARNNDEIQVFDIK